MMPEQLKNRNVFHEQGRLYQLRKSLTHHVNKGTILFRAGTLLVKREIAPESETRK